MMVKGLQRLSGFLAAVRSFQLVSAPGNQSLQKKATIIDLMLLALSHTPWTQHSLIIRVSRGQQWEAWPLCVVVKGWRALEAWCGLMFTTQRQTCPVQSDWRMRSPHWTQVFKNQLISLIGPLTHTENFTWTGLTWENRGKGLFFLLFSCSSPPFCNSSCLYLFFSVMKTLVTSDRLFSVSKPTEKNKHKNENQREGVCCFYSGFLFFFWSLLPLISVT